MPCLMEMRIKHEQRSLPAHNGLVESIGKNTKQTCWKSGVFSVAGSSGEQVLKS